MKNNIINKTDLKISITHVKKFPTTERITVWCSKIKKGIYFLVVDTCHRYDYDGILSDGKTTEIIFSPLENEIKTNTVWSVKIRGFDGLGFVSMSKRTSHITLMTTEAYNKLI